VNKALYSFFWDCGRAGSIEGLFIADKSAVTRIIGKEIYFGEVLGKHSDVCAELEVEDVTIKSEDQELIAKLEGIFGQNICGFNPLDYVSRDTP
jgi:hypothetical protein